MNRTHIKIQCLCIAAALLMSGLGVALANPTGQAGPYKIEIASDPPVVPVGRAHLIVRVTDSSGKPVEGAQVRVLARMASMDMGEKETTGAPSPADPGVYSAPAGFAMEGTYQATVTVSGPQGTGKAVAAISTGESTTAFGGASAPAGGAPWLPWLIGLALLAFIAYRVRATGQRLDARAVLNRSTLSGLLLLGAMLTIAVYAIGHWRRQGAMTPIEAQAMVMDTPAPAGVGSVTLATVTRGPVETTVRYTGQAVGYNEQDVSARTQGWLLWMPYYVGQRVKAGQLLARIDTSQIEPQIAEREAAVRMARQGVDVAEREYRQALAAVNQAQADVYGKRDALAGAQADVTGAEADRANAEAQSRAMQSQIENARAAVKAAQADRQYWAEEMARETSLLKSGAVSKEEYQRELAQSANADARYQQAEAAESQAVAQAQAAQAQVNKATAVIASAGKKVEQMASEQRASEAAVRSSQAAADAARQRITQSAAGVGQARGVLAASTTARAYSEIRAQIDGVITQRLIGPGQLVNPGQAILRVAQVTPIRLQANVAETDLGHVHVGTRVLARNESDIAGVASATVTSVSPTVDPVAHTGVVEAVVPNRAGQFAPGQYVVLDISTGGSRSTLRVPSSAIRSRTEAATGLLASGSMAYVWVAEPVAGQEGQFTAKPVPVQTGASDGVYTQVFAGLKEGQSVVTSGYEYLKEGDTVADAGAEAGAQQPVAHSGAMPGMAMPGTPSAASRNGNTASIEVTEQGFVPSSVTLRADLPASLTFTRKTESACTAEVALPEYHILQALPVNVPVVVQVTPRKGEFDFTCGMNMLRGKVIAQ